MTYSESPKLSSVSHDFSAAEIARLRAERDERIYDVPRRRAGERTPDGELIPCGWFWTAWGGLEEDRWLCSECSSYVTRATVDTHECKPPPRPPKTEAELRRKKRPPHRRLKLICRFAIRQRGLCAICNLPLEEDPAKLHLDHRTPLAAGGEDVEDNLQLTHAACNLSKGASA